MRQVLRRWIGVALLALLVPGAAAAQVRMGHFPDPQGRIAPDSEDRLFFPGEPFWITVDLPAASRPAELCLIWRTDEGEVLSRALATTPPSPGPLTLMAPDTRRWQGRDFHLEVVPREGPGLGCSGPPVASARFALAVPREAAANGGPESHLPPFPWPPPRPAGRELLARDLLARPAPPRTFGETADRLLAALSECGYHDRSFYGVPGGFALATRLEQIEADGTPKPEPQRWSLAVPAAEVFDLRSFFRALFNAPEGHYRVLVFIARQGSVPGATEEADRETVDAWALGGDLLLPPELAARAWGDGHHVTVLVYQFQITGLHGEPVTNPEGAPPVSRHLARSGLLAALTR